MADPVPADPVQPEPAPTDPSTTDPATTTTSTTAAAGPAGRSRASRRSRRRQRPWWRRLARRLFTVVVLLALLLASYYVGLMAYADNRVARADVLRPSGSEIVLPERQEQAQNFLVVGADDDGPDTVMLAHLGDAESGDADSALTVAVVFPGDAYVDVPACVDGQGNQLEPYGGAFGTVFDTGGAACLVRTVQALTGIRITSYVELDLAGFPAMVDALGGVPLCLATPVRDPATGLDLDRGETLLDGGQTLPFLRVAAERGAAEAERIRRQQQFLGSVVDRALSARTVADPVRLTSFLTRTAGALTLDPDTSLRDLRSLAGLLTDLGTATVPLLTAPIADPDYQPITGGPAYTLLDDQLGRQLYRSIVEQTGLAVPPGGANAEAAEAAGQAAQTAAPSDGCG